MGVHALDARDLKPIDLSSKFFKVNTTDMSKTSKSLSKAQVINEIAEGRSATKTLQVEMSSTYASVRRKLGADWLWVTGCAGSGKTELAVERVKNLIARGVTTDTIVLITFSAAALERLEARMRAAGLRVGAMLGVHMAVRGDSLCYLSEHGDEVSDCMVNLIVDDLHLATSFQIEQISRLRNVRSLLLLSSRVPEYVTDPLYKVMRKRASFQEAKLGRSFRIPVGLADLVEASAKCVSQFAPHRFQPPKERPTLAFLPNEDTLVGVTCAVVTDLIGKDVRRDSIAIICASGKLARRMTLQLHSISIPATAQTHTRFAVHLRRSLWLSSRAQQVNAGGGGEVFDEEAGNAIRRAMSPVAWARLVKTVSTIRAPSFESIYCASWKAYLRALGGQNQRHNRSLRNYLSNWEPLTRVFPTPRELLAFSCASEGRISCLTPHAARGGEWAHVFVMGLGQGVFARREGDATMGAARRQLACDAITRSSGRVWLLGQAGDSAACRKDVAWLLGMSEDELDACGGKLSASDVAGGTLRNVL